MSRDFLQGQAAEERRSLGWVLFHTLESWTGGELVANGSPLRRVPKWAVPLFYVSDRLTSSLSETFVRDIEIT
jgi:hypothetical protein